MNFEFLIKFTFFLRFLPIFSKKIKYIFDFFFSECLLIFEKRLDDSDDQMQFFSDELEGIWIYKPLNFFRNKRVKIITDLKKFKEDFTEKLKLSLKAKENLPNFLLKKKTMSAGNPTLITKTHKNLNDRITFLQNINTFKFQIAKNNIKLPAIQRATSIKKTAITQLPPLKLVNKEIMEDLEPKNEYVFKYKYISSKAIFQKYIEKPFLYEGRKTELRYK